MIPLIYIAGPFRGRTPYDVHCNVFRAEAIGLEVARLGGMPIIPHTMTAHFDKQLTDEFWLEGYKRLLAVCDAIVLSPNWRESAGSRNERLQAEQDHVAIFYWDDQGDRARLPQWIAKQRARRSIS